MEIGPIESDIPVPGKGKATGLTATLRAMQPGQSAFVTQTTMSNMSGRIANASTRNGGKYTCRTVVENGVKGVRIWRVS